MFCFQERGRGPCECGRGGGSERVVFYFGERGRGPCGCGRGVGASELCFVSKSTRKAPEDVGEEVREVCSSLASTREVLEDAGEEELRGLPYCAVRLAAEFSEIPNRVEVGDIPDGDTLSDDRTISANQIQTPANRIQTPTNQIHTQY